MCDDCDVLHHGDCPTHGPLKPLDDITEHDQASLTYTSIPVPTQLTVKPSTIPGAGLGVFATQFIPKRVRVGPYEGKRVAKQDLKDFNNNEYSWEVCLCSAKDCNFERGINSNSWVAMHKMVVKSLA